jgi:uncharacterized protein
MNQWKQRRPHYVAVERFLLWTGLDAWRAEAANVDLGPDELHATGTQFGTGAVPYRLDYRLDTDAGFVTRRLDVEAAGNGWMRSLHLTHDRKGRWRCEAKEHGGVALPAAGGDVDALFGALDCDLGLSPLTNLMPICRHDLHKHPGAADFLMAWVSVPDLGLHPSRQHYEHVRAGGDGAVVRNVDLGTHHGFVSELELDLDGLVVVYPQLARRVNLHEGGLAG